MVGTTDKVINRIPIFACDVISAATLYSMNLEEWVRNLFAEKKEPTAAENYAVHILYHSKNSTIFYVKCAEFPI